MKTSYLSLKFGPPDVHGVTEFKIAVSKRERWNFGRFGGVKSARDPTCKTEDRPKDDGKDAGWGTPQRTLGAFGRFGGAKSARDPTCKTARRTTVEMQVYSCSFESPREYIASRFA